MTAPNITFQRRLDPVALHGLAGDIVRALDPVTEADPVGVLVNVLALFGGCVGLRPRMTADGAVHHCVIWPVIVGRSSRSRKSTGRNRVRLMMATVPNPPRHRKGFASGQAVIQALADEVVDDDGKVVVKGTHDKRLVISEDEFARVLKAGNREGSIMADVLRDAWDGIDLEDNSMGRGEVRVSGPHVVVSAAITREELRKTLSATDEFNGFANRFAWFYVDRSKLLPSSPTMDRQIADGLADRLIEAVRIASNIDEMKRSPPAENLWVTLYGVMASDTPGGLVEALSSRAEAQVLRLSMLYALLDGEPVIDVVHLQAAWEVWQYSRASCDQIFGDMTGDGVADKLLTAIRKAESEGITRTTIVEQVFAKSVPRQRVTDAVGLLVRQGLIQSTIEPTAGRPVERFFAVAARPILGARPAELTELTEQSPMVNPLNSVNSVNSDKACTVCDRLEGIYNYHDERVCGPCLAELAGAA